MRAEIRRPAVPGRHDLNAKPGPVVIQNVYFPSPQSVNVGVVFAPMPASDGTFALYVSGGYENKIWIFNFHPGSQNPITPVSPGPNTLVEAPFIDVSGFATAANSPRYNSDRLAVYPTGISIIPTETVLLANIRDVLDYSRSSRPRRLGESEKVI